MNKVILIGRLTADPEKIVTGQSVLCKFGFATKEIKETTFHTIVVWGSKAENCLKYLNKGSLVAIVGKINYRHWEDEKGQKKYATEIIADEINFLQSKPKENDENLPF